MLLPGGSTDPECQLCHHMVGFSAVSADAMQGPATVHHTTYPYLLILPLQCAPTWLPAANLHFVAQELCCARGSLVPQTASWKYQSLHTPGDTHSYREASSLYQFHMVNEWRSED